MKRIVTEVCCGSYEDALAAYRGGADRIELNSALALGGLTPTAAVLRMVKESAPDLKVAAMVRPRGAGFCYTDEEHQVMLRECREILDAGADGVVFGSLKADGTLHETRTRELLELIHGSGREAVFHRAFDCCPDLDGMMEALIGCGVDRVLTSGGRMTAIEGAGMLAELQKKYGDQMEILAGSGINPENVSALIRQTGVRQVHSSCKGWRTDPTTKGAYVTYAMYQKEHEMMYDAVSEEVVRRFVSAAKEASSTLC